MHVPCVCVYCIIKHFGWNCISLIQQVDPLCFKKFIVNCELDTFIQQCRDFVGTCNTHATLCTCCFSVNTEITVLFISVSLIPTLHYLNDNVSCSITSCPLDYLYAIANNRPKKSVEFIAQTDFLSQYSGIEKKGANTRTKKNNTQIWRENKKKLSTNT